MVASCTGQGKHNNRSTRRGGSDSGSDFLTTKFSPIPQESDSTDVQNGALAVPYRHPIKQAMAYKEANPLMFVRIIVPKLARVMNTNNSRCYPWEDKKQ
ncbi:hypothetical protein ACFC2F_05175 [Enterobacter sichuanensis]|uniref:hypothetical protein n=1 Tax=Enterobacter sichuanensis TaxID=2071710 RepID=UPI0036D3FFC7